MHLHPDRLFFWLSAARFFKKTQLSLSLSSRAKKGLIWLLHAFLSPYIAFIEIKWKFDEFKRGENKDPFHDCFVHAYNLRACVKMKQAQLN